MYFEQQEGEEIVIMLKYLLPFFNIPNFCLQNFMSQLLTKNISTNIIVLPTHKLAAASMVTPEHVIQI